MKVIVDASPIINLSLIEKLNLLKELYKEILITEAVYEEVVIEGHNEPGSTELEKSIKKGWIKIIKVNDKLAVESLKEHFGKGEAETIIAGKEKSGYIVLLDDREARSKAHIMGLKVSGTIGVLLLAKKYKKISDLKIMIDQLRKEGFRISDELYQKVCK